MRVKTKNHIQIIGFFSTICHYSLESIATTLTKELTLFNTEHFCAVAIDNQIESEAL